jgi:hypothetical protein
MESIHSAQSLLLYRLFSENILETYEIEHMLSTSITHPDELSFILRWYQ